MLHNETVNVWSHALGVIAFICLFLWTVSSLYASATYKELQSRDPFYIDKTIQNRAEVSLMSHSSAGNINDFEKLVQDYLLWNVSSKPSMTSINASNALNRLLITENIT